MFGKVLLALSLLALARAQIPSLGFCPDYVPMANFDMDRFLGVWYEAERYFQLTEVVSRCVTTNYTRTPDGKYHVSNEVTNRFTGIKRILDGEIKKPKSKAEEGKLQVKYTVPLISETKYSVLETDYDSYAVLWNCANLGLFHAQSAWLMTRERLAPGKVIQKAYGVLDKYKISKSFFVKTDQDDCAYLASIPGKPAEEPVPASDAEGSSVQEAAAEDTTGTYRFAVVPDAPNIILQTRRGEPVPEESGPVADGEKVDKVDLQEQPPVNAAPEKILKVAEIEKPIAEDSVETEKEQEKTEEPKA